MILCVSLPALLSCDGVCQSCDYPFQFKAAGSALKVRPWATSALDSVRDDSPVTLNRVEDGKRARCMGV